MKKLFKRKIYKNLKDWKENRNGETALLIEGARRVGKSTIVEEFGKNEYKSYLLIDFSKENKNLINLFNDLSNLDIFFRNFFLALNISPLPKGSLIVFDEIQFCPKARQSLKHLVKDKRYHYIETGSLISIKENVIDIQIPSEEEKIEMFPLDYEEFLEAIGLNYETDSLNNIFSNKEYDINSNLHKKFMEHYRLYLCVGGMPSVISKYLETKDFIKVEEEKKLIYNLYLNDLEKIDKKYDTICSLIYKMMPAMLTKHNNKFIFSIVKSRKTSLKLQNSIDKLVESKIVLITYKIDDPKLGLILTRENNDFKLYYSDVGLFTSIVYGENLIGSENIYQRLIFDKLDSNFGALYENFVCQILKSNSLTPYFFEWKQDNKRYEIDFITSSKNKLILIEVKSGNNISSSSFIKFKEKYKVNIKESYIISNKNYIYKDNIVYLPMYLTYLIS